MSQDYVVEVNIINIHKRLQPSKHYVYEMVVKWSNNKIYHIYRRYSELFDLQNKLLNRFENVDAIEHERVLPFMPGKIIFGRSHIRAVAIERRPQLNEYCKKLIALPANYSRCNHVIEFFRVNDNDVKDFSNENDDSDSSENGSIGKNKPMMTSASSSTTMSVSTSESLLISKPLDLKEYYFTSDYQCEAVGSGEKIAFNRLTKVLLINKYLNGWCYVQYQNQNYWVPFSFLATVDNSELMSRSTIQQLKNPEEHVVTKDFKATKSDEISIEKGTRVKVLEKNFNGWWKIEYAGRIGITPGFFLQPVSFSANEISSEAAIQQEAPKKVKPPRPPPPSVNRINSPSQAFVKPSNLISSNPFINNDKNNIDRSGGDFRSIQARINNSMTNIDHNNNKQNDTLIKQQRQNQTVTTHQQNFSDNQTSSNSLIQKQTITKLHSIKPNNNIPTVINQVFYASEDYIAATRSGVNLKKGQRVVVIDQPNSEEYKVKLDDGTIGIVSKHILEQS